MNLFAKKRNRIIAQILFWASLMLAMNLMFSGTDGPADVRYRNYIHIFSATAIVLLNGYWLIPRFFAQKRYGAYTIGAVLCVLAFMFLADRIEHYLLAGTRQPPPRQLEMRQLQSDGPVAEVTPGEGGPRKGPQGPIDPRFFITFIIYSAVLLAGTMLESVQLYNQQAYLVSQARNEQLQTELKFLKSQINPHFLFNALNNVYTLSLIGSEQTPEVVMKLSEMLRYMLYESNQERVSLGQEVQYIQNYVSLQQLKDDLPLAVETRLDVTHPEMRIAPMILIPFVENAFKHSKIEDTEHGWIRIELREEAQALTFVVRNSRSAATFTKDATGGIGLANVRRRLELEYPGRHQLLIDEEEEQFAIVLTIQSL